MKESHKRNRSPKYKAKYRVKNWKESEEYRRNRGNTTLCSPITAIKSWKLQASPEEEREVEATIADKILNQLSEFGRATAERSA